MDYQKLFSYIQIGLFQAFIISSAQYIYQEVNKKIGIALLYIPLGVLLSYNISDETIPEYIANYALSGIVKAAFAFLLWYLFEQKKISRIHSQIIVCSVFALCLFLFLKYGEV